MKAAYRVRVCAVLLISVALICSPSWGSYPYAKLRPERLKQKPLQFSPPEPYKAVLPNGMVVYVLEDRSLPLVSAAAYVKAGSVYDPPERIGLASIVGSVMRTGGAAGKSGDQVDEELETIAASVDCSVGPEYATVRLSTLSRHCEKALQLFADILTKPDFQEDKLNLAKQQALEAIRRRNDYPYNIASREFARLVYGKESPWAWISTPDTIKAIRRSDLVEFHSKFYRPNNTILAVSGDFKKDEIIQQLNGLFASWQAQEVVFPKIQPVEERFTPGLYLIHKDVPQSVIVMGHLGVRRLSPERYAIQVLNSVLGAEGFISRMVSRVRTERGLAYSVWAAISPGADRGLFRAVAMTRSSNAAEAIKLMRETIAEMLSKPPSDEEMAVAKNTIVNSFIFEYDTPEKLVNARAELELLGYPPDYLKTFPDGIRAVTKQDVLAAARKYLNPDKMVILVVGNSAELRKQLQEVGSVTDLALESYEDGG
jgi:zinc protease